MPDEGDVRFYRGRWERYHNGRWVPIADPTELRQAAALGVAAAKRAAKASPTAQKAEFSGTGRFAAKKSAAAKKVAAKPAAKKGAAKKPAAKKPAAKKAR